MLTASPAAPLRTLPSCKALYRQSKAVASTQRTARSRRHQYYRVSTVSFLNPFELAWGSIGHAGAQVYINLAFALEVVCYDAAQLQARLDRRMRAQS